MGIEDVPPFKNKEAEEFYFEGNDHRKEGDMVGALAFYQKAYQIEPSHVLNTNNLANAYLMLEQYDQAAFYYKKALETDPANEMTYVNYLNYAIVSRRFKEGITFGKKALKNLKAEQMIAMAELNLALIHQRLDDCDSAMYYYHQAEVLKDQVDPQAFESVGSEINSKCN